MDRALPEAAELGTWGRGQRDCPHSESSLDTDVVSHRDRKRSRKLKARQRTQRDGAATSPNSGQGSFRTDSRESQASPGASANSGPWTLSDESGRPHHPHCASPTSMLPLPHPTSAQWPAPGAECFSPFPPWPLPRQCRPDQFSCQGDRIRLLPSLPDSRPALPSTPSTRLQRNFLKPNPGISHSLQLPSRLLGTQDGATQPPPTEGVSVSSRQCLCVPVSSPRGDSHSYSLGPLRSPPDSGLLEGGTGLHSSSLAPRANRSQAAGAQEMLPESWKGQMTCGSCRMSW